MCSQTGAGVIVINGFAPDSVNGTFRLELAAVTGGAAGKKNFWNGEFSIHK